MDFIGFIETESFTSTVLNRFLKLKALDLIYFIEKESFTLDCLKHWIWIYFIVVVFFIQIQQLPYFNAMIDWALKNPVMYSPTHPPLHDWALKKPNYVSQPLPLHTL